MLFERRVLVLGAGGTAGLNFIKSLRASGKEYFIVAADCNEYHLALCDADKTYDLAPWHAAGREKFLEYIVRENDITFIHAQPDCEVEWLAKKAHRLHADTFLPSLRTILTCRDKLKTNRELAAFGIPVPKTIDFRGVHDGWGVDLGPFPLWIRCRRGAGSKGALPVYSLRQAEDWVKYWQESGRLEDPEFLLCEYLPGDEYAWQSVWRNGTLLVSQGRKRIEYLFGNIMPSGQSSTPSVAVTVQSSELNELCYNAVRVLDPHANGIFCIDAKVNRDNKICITEINAGRFFTTSDFFTTAGCNMPDLYVEEGLGEDTQGRYPEFDVLEAGLWWVRGIDHAPVLLRNGFTSGFVKV